MYYRNTQDDHRKRVLQPLLPQLPTPASVFPSSSTSRVFQNISNDLTSQPTSNVLPSSDWKECRNFEVLYILPTFSDQLMFTEVILE